MSDYPTCRKGDNILIPARKGGPINEQALIGTVVSDGWHYKSGTYSFIRYYTVEVTYRDMTGKTHTTTIEINAERVQKAEEETANEQPNTLL